MGHGLGPWLTGRVLFGDGPPPVTPAPNLDNRFSLRLGPSKICVVGTVKMVALQIPGVGEPGGGLGGMFLAPALKGPLWVCCSSPGACHGGSGLWPWKDQLFLFCRSLGT